MDGAITRIPASVFFGVALLGFVLSTEGQAAPAIADQTHALVDISGSAFKPDQDLVQALARNDHAAVGKLLDDDFTWTDAQGRTLTKAQTIENLPAPALGMENQVEKVDQVDRKIAIHRSASGNIYVLRVWVKRGAIWRLLVYQEVSQLAAAPPTETGGEQDCENPCQSVPFEPGTEDEREVIHAYQEVERAVTAHDSAAWGAVIADEFFAVTSNSDRPLAKRTRMAGLDNQKQAGIAAFPLVNARMFQFGDTMVMTSLQQPSHGKPLHVTRIWSKRGGKWLEVLSYQTTIQ